MSERTDSTAIIVTNDGTIAGYMDMSYVGQDIEKALPAYYDAFNKVLESGNEDMTFNYNVNGKTLIFSSKIKNNWCMMLSVKESELYGNADRQVAANIIINILLILVCFHQFIGIDDMLKWFSKWLTVFITMITSYAINVHSSLLVICSTFTSTNIIKQRGL
jgi:hypothetical protein